VLKRVFPIAFFTIAMLASPSPALAHAGRSPSAAVDDRARISSIEPTGAPFEVAVVDGDQDLWLRVEPGNELIVLGSIGEPFLRFSDGGVYANSRSSTAATDLFGLVATRPSLNPRTPPDWSRLTSGTTYLWHDHRLHALALIEGGGPPRRLGSWVIPLTINGKKGAITGELSSVAPPARWFWLLLPLAILLAVFALVRSGRLAMRRGVTYLTALTIVAVLTARTGRDLYGRPDVGAARQLSIAVGSVLVAVALERLLRGSWGTKLIVAMASGVIGIVEGLTLLPAFWHGLVLVAVPSGIERLAIALALGGGIASLALTFAGGSFEPHPASVARAEPPIEPDDFRA
jgi:hypothetical protein